MRDETYAAIVRQIERFPMRGDNDVNIMTCGHCGRSWHNGLPTSLTPAPSGRCPFEYEHEAESISSKYTANEIIRILRDEHGIPSQTGRLIIQMVISFGAMSIGRSSSASWRGYSPAGTVSIVHHEDIPFTRSNRAFSIMPDPNATS